jgi:ribonuclease P/MRP protein subunit POP7
VPKVVYVGTNTPFMSAVKRVQKLLRLAERRATAPLLDEKSKKRLLVAAKAGEGERERLLLASQEKLKEEKVFVKATGRAMEKALGVGKWFQERTEAYEVSVRTGSVCVVDDIVPPDDEPDADARDDQTQLGGDRENPDAVMDGIEDGKKEDTLSESKNQRRRRRKRERVQKQRREVAPDDDDDDNDGELPESRTRWINMVEVAINLK